MEYYCRLGDGHMIKMSKEELKTSIEEGTNDAAERGRIPALSDDEQEFLLDIFCDPHKHVSVERGNEVVMTHDIGTIRIDGDQGNSGVGIPTSRFAGILIHERAFGTDTMELGHIDYSFKPVKPIIAQEQQTVERVNLLATVLVVYGAMPNLGLYYYPDGPFANPSERFQAGDIGGAREAQEHAAEHAHRDMVYIMKKLWEVGCEGVNFDTTAAAGDADFYATLKAAEELKKETGLVVEMGMAAENVIGIHGELEYQGTRLAGLYPHEQVKVAEKAGVDVFGPVVNTNTSRDMAWNTARAVTFVKACVEASSIPIHVNMGMGVGGNPMFETPPTDMVTRASKAMVEIAKVDGI